MHKTSNTFSKLLSILNNNPFFRALIFTAGLFLISVMGLYALFFVGQASETDLNTLLAAFISFIPYFYAICAFLFLLPLIRNFVKRHKNMTFIITILIFSFLFGPYRFILFASDNRIFTNCREVTDLGTWSHNIDDPYFECNEGRVYPTPINDYILPNTLDKDLLFTQVGNTWHLKPEFNSKQVRDHYYITKKRHFVNKDTLYDCTNGSVSLCVEWGTCYLECTNYKGMRYVYYYSDAFEENIPQGGIFNIKNVKLDESAENTTIIDGKISVP